MPGQGGLTLSQDQVLLVTLLAKIGLIACVATLLPRFDTFKRMFFREREGIRARLYFIALMGTLFCVGVGVRILLGYAAADISLEGSLLSGLIAGPWVGMAVGIVVGAPSYMVGEVASIPRNILAGLVGGLLHGICFRRIPRIRFSPLGLFFIGKYRPEGEAKPKMRNDLFLLTGIIVVRIAELVLLYTVSSEKLYAPSPEAWWAHLALLFGTVVMIGVPLMIWDHTYVEMALADHERGLVQARLDALKHRIQPHFLFNTLNTIGATIRLSPPRAREMVLQLANILRGVLESKDDFRTLDEELKWIRDYLDLQRARFGDDRLVFETDIDEAARSARVPNLLIQPIVENSLIHGLRRQRRGGTIWLAARRNSEGIEIVVRDNGAGMSPDRLSNAKQVGIGLSNVDERLKVLYGNAYQFEMESEEGKGTSTTIRFPWIDERMERPGHA